MATRTEGPQWEPDAEAVEALRREVHASAPEFRPISHELARFILRRQHERESGLLKALKRIRAFYSVIEFGHRVSRDALAAHDKLNASNEPTLLEAAKDYVAMMGTPSNEASAYATLKAAVEREEKGA